MVRWMVLLLCACGRIGYDVVGDDDVTDDGGAGDGAAAIDASADAPPLAFGTPVAAEGLAGEGWAHAPSLTPDRREMVFASIRGGGEGLEDLWVTRRATDGGAWGTPELIAEPSGNGDDTTPELSPDGLTLYFSSLRAGSQNFDVYVATRSDRAASFGGTMRVAELSTAAVDASPAVYGGLRRMVMASTTSGGPGGYDLFLTERATDTAPWDMPARIDELATSNEDDTPYVAAGGLVVLFASDRDGNRDLYMASRPSLGEPFGEAVPLTDLNSPAVESDPWISEDLRHVFFASNRDGNTTIYEASR